MESISPAKKVAILAKDGFEQYELVASRNSLTAAGALVHIISLEPGTIVGWDRNSWGIEVKVDYIVKDVSSKDYDALILPGGLYNPDALLHDRNAIDFVKGFFKPTQTKPVAAIRQGTRLLEEANVLKGRMVTSYYDIKSKPKNVGAKWVDEDIVVDNWLLTSRRSDDLRSFNKMVIAKIFSNRAV
jgi:protease I